MLTLASTPTSFVLGALILIGVYVLLQMNIVRRTIIHRRNRKAHDPSDLGRPNTLAVDPPPVITTVNVDFTLSGPFSLNGIPQILSVGANGSLPTAASKLSATVLRLTYALTQAASTDFIVPDQDPAVRTANGGYLIAGTFQP